MDVFESQDEVWFFYALPGVPAGQVEVALEGTELVVRGERSLPPVAHTTTIRRLELPHGRFERRVALPTGRYDLIDRRRDPAYPGLLAVAAGRRPGARSPRHHRG